MAPIANALQAEAGPSPHASRTSRTAGSSSNATRNLIRLSETPPISSRPPSTLPSRLTRSEVASFLPFVRDLDIIEQSDLSARLARPTSSNAKPDLHRRDRNGFSSRGEAEAVQHADERTEAEDTDSEEERSGTEDTAARSSKIRRVDGPDFAPSYQDTSTSNRPLSKKRKRDLPNSSRGSSRFRRATSPPSQWDEREMNRWPVMPSELHVEVSDETLEESIESFASRYIRINNMTLARTPQDSSLDDIEEPASRADGRRIADQGLDEAELEPESPEGLVSSTVDMVNRILVGLAGCRPPDYGRKRKSMEIIDWMGVLDVAGITRTNVGVVKSANARLRELYQAEDQDLLSHRLDILYPNRKDELDIEDKEEEVEVEAKSKSKSSSYLTKRNASASASASANANAMLDELYAPVIPKKDTAIRLHQSKEEQQRRAEKRQLKERKRKLAEDKQDQVDQVEIVERSSPDEQRRKRAKTKTKTKTKRITSRRNA